MKLWKKWIGGTLVVLVVAGAGVAWRFQNEIQAVRYYLEYSQEEQATLEQENEATLADLLQKANLPAEIFADTSLSADEVAKKLEEVAQQQSQLADEAANATAAESEQSVAGQEQTTATGQGQDSNDVSVAQNYDAELAAMVGEIYALRASFVGQLDSLLQQAKSEYLALSPEQREKQKTVLVSKSVGLASNLESNCDSKMEDILSRIQKHLKEIGGDTSLVKEIRKVYENEKAMKKSQYMSMVG